MQRKEERDWLAAQPALENTGFVRHIRLPEPLEVIMNGRTGEGVILTQRT